MKELGYSHEHSHLTLPTSYKEEQQFIKQIINEILKKNQVWLLATSAFLQWFFMFCLYSHCDAESFFPKSLELVWEILQPKLVGQSPIFN